MSPIGGTSGGDGNSGTGVVVGSIIFFLCSTTTLTFFNKWFLNGSALGFKHPFFVGGTHQLLSFVYTLIFEHIFLTKLAGPIARKPRYFLILCPIGLLCAADWGSSNFSLKTVPLSLYEMIKSTTPMFTLVISIIFGLQPPAPILISAIGAICLGTYFSVVGANGAGAIFTANFPLLGASVLLMGSFASGFKAVVSQFVMQKVMDPETGKSDVNGVTMVYYLAPITSTSLFLMSMLTEGKDIVHWMSKNGGSAYAWLAFELIASAFAAFAVTISAFILMRKTSGLAYTVVKIGQRVGIVGLAMLTFGDHVPFANAMGFALSLSGIALYNYYEIVHKHKKAAAVKAQAEAAELTGEGKKTYGATSV